MQNFSFIRLSFRVAILAFGLLLIPNGARAGSATWKQVPATGEWTSANNWTPATVPNGDTDVATFSSSNIVAITVAAAVEVSDIDFAVGASAYSVTPLPGVSLTLSGGGITNESTLNPYVGSQGRRADSGWF
ncbi:MAG: hypothetical protein H0X40_16260 [Chthoniobacterales bacterium]|nr:hypothetical protein [Chthoniobacterales bacterium]